MRYEDRQWVGKTLFVKEHVLISNLQHWYHPPQVKADGQTRPEPEPYFVRRLFVWMPRKMYLFDFKCPSCPKRSLTSKGIYNKVRLVLDLKEYYYLVTEYLTCSSCRGTFQSWDSRLLQQLPDHIGLKFPALLTHKYACDKAVVAMMRSRTLGNSSNALRNTIMEMHYEEWLRRQICYLSACKTHRSTLGSLGIQQCDYGEAPPFPPFPQARWFQASFVRDIYHRLPVLKSEITSTLGKIIKIDSTKKICKKLQGQSAGTAGWCTNVGNELGQVLLSVLTTSEGKDDLEALANGLMTRYKHAGQAPPVLLYTDCYCCADEKGPSKYRSLFSEWKELEVRLDIWHYMRRIALGCSSESHPLYATFMKELSRCIFEWSLDDYSKLLHAKKAELVSSGIVNPPDVAAEKAVTKDELARHCRRKTRGTEATVEAIEDLIRSLSKATDTLGVPLLKPEMTGIWEQQKKHVKCIQDPPGLELYTLTGNIKKGGVTLPVFRCGRGTTSLESFHLHLNRFIPGTSAGAVNFQAYLLEGIHRWNKARGDAAIDCEDNSRTFDSELAQRANCLSEEIHHKELLVKTRTPMKYTGELIGIEYLYRQNAKVFTIKEEDLDEAIDQGFVEEDLAMQPLEPLSADHPDYAAIMALPGDESDGSSDDEPTTTVDTECLDSMGIPGWDKVDRLAQALLELEGLALTTAQATSLKKLYAELPAYDQKPFTYQPRKVQKPAKGAFGRTKRYRQGHISVEKMKKAFLSGGVPASHPSKSRLVEAICIHLCSRYPHPEKTSEGKVQSRWRLVLGHYNKIRAIINNSQGMETTNTMLLHLSEVTISAWYKDQTRQNEVKLLMQGIKIPSPSTTTSTPLPPAGVRASGPVCPPASLQHHFEEPEDRSGMAKLKRRKSDVSASVSSSHEAAQVQDTDLLLPAPPPVPLPLPAAKGPNILPCLPATPPASSTTAANLPPPQPLPPFKTEDRPPVPRTTAWRKRKADTGGVRKEYTCSVCNQPMTSEGHTQFRGQRYCPYVPGQVSREEWLALKKAEAAAKKQMKQ
ncbi:uncharacterized protein LOC144879237 [Branchiostoma floridae x Branchiostoma japonicum]